MKRLIIFLIVALLSVSLVSAVTWQNPNYYIKLTSESNLNVNSSDFWDDINTPAGLNDTHTHKIGNLTNKENLQDTHTHESANVTNLINSTTLAIDNITNFDYNYNSSTYDNAYTDTASGNLQSNITNINSTYHKWWYNQSLYAYSLFTDFSKYWYNQSVWGASYTDTASTNLQSNISAVNTSLLSGYNQGDVNVQANITNLNDTYNEFWYNYTGTGDYYYNQTATTESVEELGFNITTDLTTLYDSRYLTGQLSLFFYNDSDLEESAYTIMNITVPSGTTQINTFTSMGAGDTLLSKRILSTLQLSMLETGAYNQHTTINYTSGSKDVQIKSTIHILYTNGTELQIGSSPVSNVLTPGAYQQVIWTGQIDTEVIFGIGDYLTMYLYAFTSGAGGAPTIDLVVADETAARLDIGINPLDIAVTGDNSTWNQVLATTLYSDIQWGYNYTGTGDFYYNQTEAAGTWHYNQSSPYDDFNYNMSTAYNYYNQTVGTEAQYGKWWYNQSLFAYSLNSSYYKFWYNTSVPDQTYTDTASGNLQTNITNLNSTYVKWWNNQTLGAKTYADNTFLKLAGGTMAGTLAMNTNGITGVNVFTAVSNLDIGAYTITATRFISDITTGTAPFGVTSTTVVDNLNVDQVDGKDSTDFLLLDGTQAMSGNLDMGGFNITNVNYTHYGGGSFIHYNGSALVLNGGA